ncbi:glycoside hydrolase superfamily [Ephemerocybe angulata]|uniref:endo-1,4-beta-xylanase n=1 Tax=Ephemerocybe angulata TaxID=980116 RepID=A0A8H6M318_9AGAR|nr:glycoside hydrolase superfamily [Tulosesus angulatus]
MNDEAVFYLPCRVVSKPRDAERGPPTPGPMRCSMDVPTGETMSGRPRALGTRAARPHRVQATVGLKALRLSRPIFSRACCPPIFLTSLSPSMKANFVVLAVLLGAHGALGQLNILAKLAGKKYFGSAVDNPALADLPYKKKLSDITEFGQITASNTLKWETVEAVRGVYNFTGGDELVALAKKNHQLFRGHTCVWHSQLAPWVEAGNFSAKELTSIIEDHCSKIVGHYKGDIQLGYCK